MRNISIVIMLVFMIASCGDSAKNENPNSNKTQTDTIDNSHKPEGYKSPHQEDYETHKADSTKGNTENKPEVVRF